MFSLNEKIAVVTGASRGIGLAVAACFAEAGAKVVISSRKADALNAAAAEIRAKGGVVMAHVAHSGSKTDLQALVSSVVQTYGRIDILVNNAATNPHFGPLLEAEDSLWQKTIEVNIMGNVWLSQAVVPVMRQNGGGKIINIASVAGLRPGSMQGIYSMTKAAIISLTRSLAVELAADNIQVNAVAPGVIRTHFAGRLWQNDTLAKPILERTPQRRFGEPDDIAGLALYLASPASDFATGEVFVIDGGLSLPLL